MHKTTARSILILGGYGYLGTAIAEYLKNSGHHIFRAGRGNLVTNLEPNLNFDLSDQILYEQKIEELSKISPIKLSAIINCAGKSKRMSGPANINLESDKIISDSSSDTKILLNVVLGVIKKRNLFAQDFRIIDIGSIWSQKIPYSPIYLDLENEPDLSVIFSKSLKLKIVKYFAKYSIQNDFLINQISPGWFPRLGSVVRDDYINNINARIPLNRIGRPQDLFSGIDFLLDPNNCYTNGIELVIDGGYAIY